MVASIQNLMTVKSGRAYRPEKRVLPPRAIARKLVELWSAFSNRTCEIGLEFHVRIVWNGHSPVKCPKPHSLRRGNKTTLACHTSLRLGRSGVLPAPGPTQTI